ncbi:hypothetical protein SAMN04487936_12310 [Halobacillus dabanensis]|uniref:Uncharacterized protein n=1 Tax=Halobacillus dabanensis TaxID=240302 RepID=A0A1I4AYU2_HALDA|nr:hypothetical protein SAMN04487936_12310 [Halobacillus dabanensis]
MKKTFSTLGGIFFILSIIPFLGQLTRQGKGIYEFFIDISIFLPLALGLAGLLFSIFGIKGQNQTYPDYTQYWKFGLLVFYCICCYLRFSKSLKNGFKS